MGHVVFIFLMHPKFIQAKKNRQIDFDDDYDEINYNDSFSVCWVDLY